MLATTLNSLYAVLIIMFMIGMGWLFGKLGYIKREHKGLLIKLILSAGMPALIVNNVFGKLELSSLERPLLLLLPVGGMLITLLLGIILAKILKLSPKRRGTFITMCAFSNSLFIGLPMCTELFTEAAVPYVMCFYIVNTTLFWTVGNFLISKSGEGGNPGNETEKNDKNSENGDNGKIGKNGKNEKHKKGFPVILKKLLSPPLIVLIVSLSLHALGVKLPAPIIRLTGYMGNVVTPLALFYIGFTLYDYGFHALKPDKCTWGVLFVRFIAAPAVMLGLCFLFGFKGMSSGVMIIESAMPVMTLSVVLAAANGADESFAAAGMSLSTIICFVLVPVLMLLMRALKLI